MRISFAFPSDYVSDLHGGPGLVRGYKMENQLMRISSAFPSDYLRAADLQGKTVKVTMSHVTMEDIGGDPKPILHFQGRDKGMVLNKTNASKIAEMFGDDTDNWQNQPIILYEAMVDFKGQTVPAIRVRIAPVSKGNMATKQPTSAELIDDDIPF